MARSKLHKDFSAIEIVKKTRYFKSAINFLLNHHGSIELKRQLKAEAQYATLDPQRIMTATKPAQRDKIQDHRENKKPNSFVSESCFTMNVD